MRTPQQALADAIASGAVQAWIDGRKIQFIANNEWRYFDGVSPAFFHPDLTWRPTPAPTLRPWNPEEVPVGALIRRKKQPINPTHCWMIVGYNVAVIHLSNPAMPTLTFAEAMEDQEHCTDGGKTWKACGVLEGGE